MLYLHATVLLGLLLAQPATSPATPPETKPVPTAAAPVPLTDTERPLVGRWVINTAEYLKLAKATPQELGMTAETPEDRKLGMLAMGYAYLKTMTLELRKDRSLVLLMAGGAVEGTWRIADGKLAVSGLDKLDDFPIRYANGKLELNPQPGFTKAIPLQTSPINKAVKLADLNGEWVTDVDATAATMAAYLEEFTAFTPHAMKEDAKPTLDEMKKQIAASPLSVTFDGHKAFVLTESMGTKETTYTVSGDLILLKAPHGLNDNQPDAPDASIPIFADGKTLRTPMGGYPMVLKRAPEKPTPKPEDKPAK